MDKFITLAIVLLLSGCASSPAAAEVGLFDAIMSAQAIQDARLRQQEERDRVLAETVAPPHAKMQNLALEEISTRASVQARMNGLQNLQPIFPETLRKLAVGQVDILAGQLGIRGLYGDVSQEGAPPRFRDLSEIFTGGFNPALNAVMNARQVCLSKTVTDSVTTTIMNQAEMRRNLQGYSGDVLGQAVLEALGQQISILRSLEEFESLENALRTEMGQRIYPSLLDAVARSGGYQGELRQDPRFICLPKTTIAAGVLTLTEQAERILASLVPVQ